MQTQLDLANERIQQLQKQYDEVVESQSKLQETKAQLETKDSVIAEMKSQIEQIHLKNEHLLKTNENLLTDVEAKEKLASDSDAKIQEKEAVIAQKDQDMRAMEKRYKTYLDKARHVIRNLDQRNKSNSNW